MSSIFQPKYHRGEDFESLVSKHLVLLTFLLLPSVLLKVLDLLVALTFDPLFLSFFLPVPFLHLRVFLPLLLQRSSFSLFLRDLLSSLSDFDLQ